MKENDSMYMIRHRFYIDKKEIIRDYDVNHVNRGGDDEVILIEEEN